MYTDQRKRNTKGKKKVLMTSFILLTHREKPPRVNMYPINNAR